MVGLLKFLLILIGFAIFVGWVVVFSLNWRTQHDPRQAKFLKGQIPNQMPNGLYHGVVGVETSWQGKQFGRANSTGINILKVDGVNQERYPFRTYVASGLSDPQIQVIKIDYDLPTNQRWLRLILDEVVEIEPNHFLGKVHLKLTSQLHFALGYFELKK